MSHLIYLATPYHHTNPQIMQERFNIVTYVTGHLMSKGNVIFSPITHCHPVAEVHEFPRGWEFWKTFDEVYLGLAKEMYILTLPGWKESTGVAAEIEIMRKQQKPISLLDPVNYTLTYLGD